MAKTTDCFRSFSSYLNDSMCMVMNYVIYNFFKRFLQSVFDLVLSILKDKVRKTLTTAGATTDSPPSVELYVLSFASPSRIGFISSASVGSNSVSTIQWKKSNFLSNFPELNNHLKYKIDRKIFVSL